MGALLDLVSSFLGIIFLLLFASVALAVLAIFVISFFTKWESAVGAISFKADGASNPVLWREVQGRWRVGRTHFLVLGYAAILAVLAYWKYQQYAAGGVVLDGNQRPIFLPGRELFLRFNQWQMGCWLVLAPLLTAGAIAGERERGMLESLLLSPLRPAQIVWGKWYSAMGFAAVLLLVPLPVATLCFQLGGLSPFEFVFVSLAQASTAMLGASIGLFVSSGARKLNDAYSGALSGTLVWGWLIPAVVLPRIFGDPFAAFALLCGLVFVQVTVALALVSVATERLLRPLEELAPEQRRSWLESAPMPLPSSPPRAIVEPAWQTPVPVKPVEALNAPEHYKRWDMPGAERLRFENPVLQREVRVHLRLRAQSGSGGPSDMAGCALFFCFIAFVVYGIKMLFSPDDRSYFWGLFATLWLIGTALGAGTLGSTAFTRERAARMMDFLLLTCLKPRQIYWGKVAGAVLVVLYYSIALLPVLVPCMVPRFDGRGLQSGHIGGAILLVIAAAWACAAWGVFVSWLCRQSFVATSISLLGIMLFPYLPYLNEYDPYAAICRLRPFLDFYRMHYQEVPPWTVRDVYYVPGGLFVIGAVFALATLFLMRHGPRDDDKFVRG